MTNIEIRKESLKKFKEAAQKMGAPLGNKNASGGGDGDSGSGGIEPDVKEWQDASEEQRRQVGKPAGKDRNGKVIKNGDSVLVKDDTMRKPAPGKVIYKDPVRNVIHVSLPGGAKTQVKTHEVASGSSWN